MKSLYFKAIRVSQIIFFTLLLSLVVVVFQNLSSITWLNGPVITTVTTTTTETEPTAEATATRVKAVVTTTTAAAIAKTRPPSNTSAVKSEYSYKFSIQQAVSQVKDFVREYQVQQLAPKPDTVQHVFILTTWRSGSSFFGEAISSHPAIFYHYEPLIYLSFKEIHTGGKRLETAFQILGNLSHCEYSRSPEYMNALKTFWNVLELNLKIRSQCIKLKEKCFDVDFLKPTCTLFPVQVYKLTRIRGEVAEEILKRFPNSKLVYLMRDPRAIYTSRLQTRWCNQHPSFCNLTRLCEDLEDDLAEIRILQAKRNKNVLLVKYENMARQPEKALESVYKHIGLEWHDNVQKYLDEHTHKNNKFYMSTVKESAKHVDRWKYFLSNDSVQMVQEECLDFMLGLQYEFVKY